MKKRGNLRRKIVAIETKILAKKKFTKMLWHRCYICDEKPWKSAMNFRGNSDENLHQSKIVTFGLRRNFVDIVTPTTGFLKKIYIVHKAYSWFLYFTSIPRKNPYKIIKDWSRNCSRFLRVKRFRNIPWHYFSFLDHVQGPVMNPWCEKPPNGICIQIWCQIPLHSSCVVVCGCCSWWSRSRCYF